MRKEKTTSIILFCVLATVAIGYFIPIYWMIISALKPSEQIFARVELFPRMLTTQSFSVLFQSLPYGKWYINTGILTAGYVLIALLTSTLGGYAFAHFNFKGRDALFLAILITQMIPFHLMLVPLFIMISKLRLIDTYIGGFLPIAVSPFGLFYMRQYMLGLNKDLLDAARVDGASEYVLFARVVLPLVKPGLAAMAIFFSMEYWNNLLWPLVAMRSETRFPLTVGIASLVNQYRPRYDMVMAASTLATIPVIIVFLIMQRQFLEGLGAMGRMVEK
ncbi:MAG: carbohydrate ABC transporter permease [Candidatus Caldatribacteriaceae bacterium]